MLVGKRHARSLPIVLESLADSGSRSGLAEMVSAGLAGSPSGSMESLADFVANLVGCLAVELAESLASDSENLAVGWRSLAFDLESLAD